MSQLTKVGLLLVLVVSGLTLVHGYRNLGWFANKVRAEMTVGHLPVT